MSANVEIYTSPTCGFCIAAKKLLDDKQIAFNETDVANNQALRNELIEKTGHRTVPIIFVKGQFVGGYDDLHAINQSGELDTMLAK